MEGHINLHGKAQIDRLLCLWICEFQTGEEEESFLYFFGP